MENKVAYEINDFIGIFHNVIPKHICDKIVNHYEQVQSMGMTVNRKELEQTRLIDKDTDTYRLSSSPMSLEAPNEIVSSMDLYFIEEFKKAFWPCYHEYTKQYGILESIGKHGFRSAFKIQKTKPSSGYHVWHCEHGSENTSSRLLLVIVYLNDVEEGGETEFLYQRKRVKPTKGTMIIVPGAFTHTHRGNPPLTGDKYIMNTWLHFLE
jgi:hypothetical protein